MSCGRLSSGAVGTIISICAIVFLILGCTQAGGFRTLGTLGNPTSWTLWVISGGGLIVGGTLVAYAIFSKKKAKENSGQPSTQSPFELSPKEPQYVKKSFHGKIDFESLFADEENFLDEIEDYAEKLPANGKFKDALVTHSLMKGEFVGTTGLRFILLKIRCVSSDDKIDSCLTQFRDLPQDKREKRQPLIDSCRKKSVYLLFFRNKNRWNQWWWPHSLIRPSFLPDFSEGGQLGRKPMPVYEDEAYIQLQEEGFVNLKKIMKGGTSQDHYGLKWRLAHAHDSSDSSSS